MSNKVLVCYSSKYGATAKIAVKIAETLRKSSLTVDLMRVEEVNSLLPYRAVILGTAVYMGSWRKGAVSFLKRNKMNLSETPFWIFSSGPTGDRNPSELLNGWKVPKNMKSVIKLIHPKDISVFHGFVDLSKLTLFHRLVFKRTKAPEGDFREWEMIQEWTYRIASQIHDIMGTKSNGLLFSKVFANSYLSH